MGNEVGRAERWQRLPGKFGCKMVICTPHHPALQRVVDSKLPYRNAVAPAGDD